MLFGQHVLNGQNIGQRVAHEEAVEVRAIIHRRVFGKIDAGEEPAHIHHVAGRGFGAGQQFVADRIGHLIGAEQDVVGTVPGIGDVDHARLFGVLDRVAFEGGRHAFGGGDRFIGYVFDAVADHVDRIARSGFDFTNRTLENDVAVDGVILSHGNGFCLTAQNEQKDGESCHELTHACTPWLMHQPVIKERP